MPFFKFIRKFVRAVNSASHLIFPVECLGCGKEGEYLCDECLEKILRIGLFCPVCGRLSLYGRPCLEDQKISFLDALWSAASYQNKLLKKTIRIFKYGDFGGVKNLSQPLAKLMTRTLAILFQNLNLSDFQGFQPEEIKNSLIIPIPLYWLRERKRGFNQAELLAKEIAKEFKMELKNKLLVRTRFTQSQTSLDLVQRRENIKNAFSVKDRGGYINGQNCILIDDLVTTGATLQEAAKILKESGAKKVFALTLARG